MDQPSSEAPCGGPAVFEVNGKTKDATRKGNVQLDYTKDHQRKGKGDVDEGTKEYHSEPQRPDTGNAGMQPLPASSTALPRKKKRDVYQRFLDGAFRPKTSSANASIRQHRQRLMDAKCVASKLKDKL